MQRNVCVNNIEIELTYIEFEILYLLAGNPGRVFRKEQIYDINFIHSIIAIYYFPIPYWQPPVKD